MTMKKTVVTLLLISLISFFINVYKKNASPPCFTADEAAFGYNAYSLLKTGKDEYGTLLPFRLKSFGDYKMPLYSYLSIPFIAIGGLNETSARALNTFIAILFPVVIFLLTKQLFGKNEYGYLAALLFSLSPAIQVIGRQAHEGYVTTFFIALTFWIFIKIINKATNIYKFLFFISLIILSFGYQFSRLWISLLLALSIYFGFKKLLSYKFVLLLCIVFVILLLPDIIIKPSRVNNLLFFNNIGLALQTTELRNEGGKRIIYNKFTVGFKNFINSYLNYFSSQFLVSDGDDNHRFSYPGISPITIVEYLFIFIGIYYLFKDKQKSRYLIITFLFFSPVAGSLSWAGNSITRSLPIIVFINIICAYGFIRLIDSSKTIISKLILILLSISYIILCFYSWDFYYNHYPQRSEIIKAFQCGNREMTNFIKQNYNRFDKFYVTRKNGQPYIFLLFYLNYPPSKYQRQAQLSRPDEFGFGQVEKFDKFDFYFRFDQNSKKTVLIGFPDDFKEINHQNKINKIKAGTEEMYWIYSQD